MIMRSKQCSVVVELAPFGVCDTLRRLWDAGYDAYIVGGAVRDIMLKRNPHDWDIASNASLEDVCKLFPNSEVVGASFGVALIKNGGMEMQVARFRSERGYSDFRHPDEVKFLDTIEEDLLRRDFTINAMAIGKDGVLVCPDTAVNDLREGLIRTVGNPDDRFFEDPLRMMRAVRFLTQLGFRIDFTTGTSITFNADLINKISAERISEELVKILMSTRPSIGINVLHVTGLMEHVLPELVPCVGFKQNKYHIYDVFLHILKVLDLMPEDLTMRLFALFHDCGKPASAFTDEKGGVHFYSNGENLSHEVSSSMMARKRLEELRFDSKTIEEVCYLISEHMFVANPDISDRVARKFVHTHGRERLNKLIEFKRADIIGSGTRTKLEADDMIDKLVAKIDKAMSYNPPTKMDDLVFDGNDIMRITGLKTGKEVGVFKKKLMEAVLDDPNLNNSDDLTRILLELKHD